MSLFSYELPHNSYNKKKYPSEAKPRMSAPYGTPEGTRLHFLSALFESRPIPYKKQIPQKRNLFFGTPEGTRLHFLSALRKENRGVAAIELAASSSPPDCCI